MILIIIINHLASPISYQSIKQRNWRSTSAVCIYYNVITFTVLLHYSHSFCDLKSLTFQPPLRLRARRGVSAHHSQLPDVTCKPHSSTQYCTMGFYSKLHLITVDIVDDGGLYSWPLQTGTNPLFNLFKVGLEETNPDYDLSSPCGLWITGPFSKAWWRKENKVQFVINSHLIHLPVIS